MEFMGRKLEDIVVTLPFADGTSLNCYLYFTMLFAIQLWYKFKWSEQSDHFYKP